MGFCTFITANGDAIKVDHIGFFGEFTADSILSKYGIMPASITSMQVDVPDIGRFTNRYSNLRSVKLERGLFCVADSAFEDCISLQSVYIPDHVPEFGRAVFCGCSNLTRIRLPNDMDCIPNDTFTNCISLQKVFLPDTIKTICRRAFKNCKSLIRPWMPESLEYIDDEAFFGCESLGAVYIPEGVKIADDAFQGCTNLIIRGRKGSSAEQYAKNHNIAFLEMPA